MKFRIGEFSGINKVTVKTLRHYEEIGLLIPAETDRWTGYRYYSVEQLTVMSEILRYRAAGFSLEEIKLLLERGVSAELLQRRRQALVSERAAIEERLRELNLLEQQFFGGPNMEQVTVKRLEPVIVASYRTVMKSYAQLNDLYPNVLGPEMARLGCECAKPDYCFNIYHDGEYRETDIDVEVCQAVTERKEDSEILRFKELPEVPEALCISHRGSYETLSVSYAELFRQAEKLGYAAAGFPRESYLVGIWNCPDPSGWLTEIQLPVRKES